ncbi:hypothetical protein CC85DRAFT_302155 [Cutaneotrichosporon oleaginosum]|uniref:Uncharacterized protein n=1 Tax=Cutaneotrichosporon oleaginosum TaxID=879819 RepID=A0A0J1B4P2_9TREE|nr:uncharacterized protein CC85DRAFT_302155 [Cutaneotrichosporon oleaginosum]KLT42644.1 hypothetical protein CC85DRAFT_302155 [Cutaneotrichosporon oleaginosum]TXT05239.1 hypothetical protein COLE_06559 [Cutaneotrichosporon oleaginosum]
MASPATLSPERRRALATPKEQGSRKRKRAHKAVPRALTPQTITGSQPASPTVSELSGVELSLAPPRYLTPPPSTRKPTWGERKSLLSKEYIDDSDEEGTPVSRSKGVQGDEEKEMGRAERSGDYEEENQSGDPEDNGDADDDEVVESGDEDLGLAVEEEEGVGLGEVSEIDASDDDLPAYTPTPNFKRSPSTKSLVALSQVSDLPKIPNFTAQATSRQRAKRDDAEYDIFLRTQVTSEEEAERALASRWLSPTGIRRLEATGLIAVKRGKFLAAEKKAMQQQLKTFQAVNKMSDEELVDLIMSKGRYVERGSHPTFWFDLAAQVPGRPVKSVVDAVKRMYDPRAGKGMWLPSEDRALLQAQNLYPNQWSKISDAVDRSEHDCRDRWRELRDAPTRVSGPWSLEEEDALCAAVQTACAAVGRKPSAGVPWDKVVELMGRKRTAAQCRQKWKGRQIGGAFVPSGPHNVRLDRRRMLQRLRDLKYAHETDITWTELPTDDWVVRPALLKNTWSLLRRRVPDAERREMSLKDLLDKIEASMDVIDAAVGQPGASRSATKRAAASKPSRAKRMKTKAESLVRKA